MTTPSLRLATDDDLCAINEIYNYYVLNSTCTYPLEPETMQDRHLWFRDHSADRYPVLVAELEAEVVGWGSLSRFRPRAAMAPTAEASVYVRHGLHRRGIGTLILSDLIARARDIHFHSIIGSVSADQQASIALQVKFGFRNVAQLVEVAVKFEKRLDLLYMQLMLE